MKCDSCRERDAVIALTQIVNEQVSTLHLCENCAAERGVEPPSATLKSPLGSFLAAMGKGGAPAPGTPAPDGACPGCGATLQDFREAGRLGCPECYVTFGRQLRDLLRRIHGSVHHVGERYVSPGAATAEPAPAELERLREELRRAVEREEFERAADLRDRLRSLE